AGEGGGGEGGEGHAGEQQDRHAGRHAQGGDHLPHHRLGASSDSEAGREADHDVTSAATRPSRTTTSRSAYAATRGSCVTSTTVVPAWRAASTSKAITNSPGSESSEPLGS